MNIDLGHDDEISAAFEAYDRLVRWEEHDSRLDAREPIHERAAARGHIVALIANLAVAEREARSGDALAQFEALTNGHDWLTLQWSPVWNWSAGAKPLNTGFIPSGHGGTAADAIVRLLEELAAARTAVAAAAKEANDGN